MNRRVFVMNNFATGHSRRLYFFSGEGQCFSFHVSEPVSGALEEVVGGGGVSG